MHEVGSHQLHLIHGLYLAVSQSQDRFKDIRQPIKLPRVEESLRCSRLQHYVQKERTMDTLPERTFQN